MYQKSTQVGGGGWPVVATGQQGNGLYLAPDCSDFPASELPSWARDSKVTGMVISEDCVAGLGIGTSTVSVPSGDREEETRVGSTPGGSLDMQRRRAVVTHRPCPLRWTPAQPPTSWAKTHVYLRVKHREM